MHEPCREVGLQRVSLGRLVPGFPWIFWRRRARGLAPGRAFHFEMVITRNEFGNTVFAA
jgi:hypothetical protein